MTEVRVMLIIGLVGIVGCSILRPTPNYNNPRYYNSKPHNSQPYVSMHSGRSQRMQTDKERINVLEKRIKVL